MPLMRKQYDIIIIGAGPAGLFAAVNTKPGRKVLVLEKMPSPGKKLLMSGSGRCNITQSGSINDFFNHYGDAKRFIAPALKAFTNEDLIDYLHHHGLNTINIKGKIFPSSQYSQDVLELLLDECRKNNVQINTTESVLKAEYRDGSFVINSSKDKYISSKLLIATGGKSYPTTGSTGGGYRLAEQFGHTIEKPKPALSPAYIKDYKYAGLSGISLNNRDITIFRNSKKIFSHRGDFGFTHWGLSGPGILDLARYIEPGDTIGINLIDVNPDTLREEFIKAKAENGKSTVKKFLKNYSLPENLINTVLMNTLPDAALQLAAVNKKQRSAIIEAFCSQHFKVNETGGFNIAMATKGGVSLKEVNPKTMESRLQTNLYFAGEVLDIDGDTGGYNLQAAFSTGYVVGRGV